MGSEGSGGVLFVHAHPDDESMGTGGTIARLVAEGVRVDLVTCTDGAEGEIHDPTLDVEEARPRLAQIRADELARLRVCAADDCEDVVVDLSKNRSKRFCDGGCGNRANVAAYRARRRQH